MSAASKQQIDSIPQELRSLSTWILWKKELRDGKETKVPYQVNGHLASTTDPNMWVNFDDALAAFNPSEYSGLGCVITPPFIGVDIDHCRDPKTGELDQRGLDAIKMLATYGEISQSGTGLHFWLRGEMPSGGNRRDGVEIYGHGRYFTMTGLPAEGVPLTISTNQEGLSAFHAKYILNGAGSNTAVKPKDKSQSGDDMRLAIAIVRKLGVDTSEEELIAEFRARGVPREKWNRPDYIPRTIEAAVRTVQQGLAAEDAEPEVAEEPLPPFPIISGTIADLADVLCPDIPRELKIMAMVTRIGLILSGRVRLENEPHLQPRFYTCMVAPIAYGKTAANNEASRLFDGVRGVSDEPDYLTISSVDSAPALVDVFNSEYFHDDEPAKILLNPDEMADLFEKAKFLKDSRNNLMNELLKLFEGNKTGNRSRKFGNIEINNAHLALIGGAPPSVYARLWGGTAGGSIGLQSRLTLVTTTANSPMPAARANTDEKEVAELVRRIREQIKAASQIIRVEPQAAAMLNDWWATVPDKEIATRVPDLIKRFLIVLAVTNGRNSIEPWLMQFGIEFGEYQIKLRERFNPDDSWSWVQSFENRILAVVRNQGAMTTGTMRNFVRPDRNPGGYGSFLQAVKNLTGAGALVSVGKTQRAVKWGVPK